MKQYIIPVYLCLMTFAGCAGKSHGHNHDHDDHGHTCDHTHEHAEASDPAEHADEIIFTPEQAEAVGLQTETVMPGRFHHTVKINGQLRTLPGREITLAATASGILSFADPSISEGMDVHSGETIATVAAGSLPEGDPVVKAKIAYGTALKEFRRAEDLNKAGVLSDREFEQAKATFETAKVIYEAQAGKHSSSGLRITSPISGFIRAKLAGQGEYVSTGQAIAIIAQSEQLQLHADMPAKHYRQLGRFHSANFKIAGTDTLYKLAQMNGGMIAAGKATGQSSAFIPLTFEFDNIDDLLPGVWAEVYLLFNPFEALSVPVAALTEESGLYFVYLRIDEEGYRRQEVKIGVTDGERVVAVEGLNAGDEVVTRGAFQVKMAANAGVIPEGHAHSH
jgi:RND family efflux transporter MFP subunit